MQEKINIIYI